MATRRVNPRLMAAFEREQQPPIEPNPDLMAAFESVGASPPAPEALTPPSRFERVRQYLESTRQPMPQPTTPEVDVGAAADFDAERDFGQSMLAAGQAFTGNRKAVAQLPMSNAMESQALGEKGARKRELEQWAAGKERQRMGEAALLSSAAIEPREASKPSKTTEQIDRELDLKEFANETGRIKAEKVKPPKAPKDPDSSKLRKEFDALPEVKSFKDVSIGMDKIRTAAKSGTAPGDMALIFAFMKILDPGSSVKEGEYASAKDAQGVPDKVRTAYNKALAGEILAPDTRAAFVRESEGLYETERARYSAAAQRYRGLAEKQKMAPDDVAMDRPAAGGQSEPMVNVKRKSDGKVLPLPKSKASTLDESKYEVMP